MKNLLICVCGLIAMMFCFSPSFAQATRWVVDSGYSVKFEGKGAEGVFSGLRATVLFDKDQLKTSKIEVSVDVSTIDTGNSLKNKHARGEDWFDAEKYPAITFHSSGLSTETGPGKFTMKGTLALHGKKKEVSIPFTFDQKEENKAIFTGTFTVNRQDFGIEGPMISFMVGDTFDIHFYVPVSKK